MGDVVERNGGSTGLRTLLGTLFERLALGRYLGTTHGGKRDVFAVLGYPDAITPQEYRFRYARGGVAARCVDALPKATWRGDGELYEDEDPETQTAFETAWAEMNTRLRLWPMLQRSHVMASLGSYSVILLGADGEFDQELPKGAPDTLFYVQPFGGGVVSNVYDAGRVLRAQARDIGADASVLDWEEDVHNPRFGLPRTYQLRRFHGSTAEIARPVHWSRVVHVPAPGFLDDEVFGSPVLQPVWNYLIDLDKVVGGGSEAFWLRANAGLQIDVDKRMGHAANNTAGPLPTTEELESLREQAEAYEHQVSRILRTRGVNVNQLGSDVADFQGPSDAILTLIAGTLGIPKRILTGSEMGQLASEQDRSNWRDVVNDCRSAYAGPFILRPFVERLVEYGYLPRPAQWDVYWPDVAAMDENEKLDAASKAIALNDHGEVVVTGAEIRETYLDLEPLSEDEKKDARPDMFEEPEPIPEAEVPSRAAEDAELAEVLRAAIETESIEVINAILGLRTAGGPGSGHHSHAGRPGQVGGSLPSASGAGGPHAAAFNELIASRGFTPLRELPDTGHSMMTDQLHFSDASKPPTPEALEGISQGLDAVRLAHPELYEQLQQYTQIGWADISNEDTAAATTSRGDKLIFNAAGGPMNPDPAWSIASRAVHESAGDETVKYKTVLMHEMGHAVDGMYELIPSASVLTTLQLEPDGEQALTRLAETVSQYSTAAPQEAWAELYAARLSGYEMPPEYEWLFDTGGSPWGFERQATEALALP